MYIAQTSEGWEEKIRGKNRLEKRESERRIAVGKNIKQLRCKPK